ncbi:hypothetical protein NGRA_3051 [Nosema granulosis]|uniref:Uncharacterized protein n=1 Tax=Nosema granulosis TaxID=83296 RepID=A0A9P6GW01_9MICR|nr:hypothetical protein NGRA_3051 [Nosema granulosis]
MGNILRRNFVCLNILFGDFTNKDEMLSRIAAVSLSINTVKDRILANEEDVTGLLLQNLRTAKILLNCLDENTDITSNSLLAVLVCFFFKNSHERKILNCYYFLINV